MVRLCYDNRPDPYSSPLFVPPKDRSAVIASTDHVIDSSGVFDPDRSRHEPNLLPSAPHCNQLHLCKPDPMITCPVPRFRNNFLRRMSQSLWPSLVKYTAAGVRYPRLMCSLS